MMRPTSPPSPARWLRLVVLSGSLLTLMFGFGGFGPAQAGSFHDDVTAIYCRYKPQLCRTVTQTVTLTSHSAASTVTALRTTQTTTVATSTSTQVVAQTTTTTVGTAVFSTSTLFTTLTSTTGTTTVTSTIFILVPGCPSPCPN